MSSRSPERDFARTLLGKAREDLDALGALHERGGIADAILGFHAQQAVEKALKALLVDHGWELRRTHDLRFLLEQAAALDIELPEPVASAGWLTPWAAELRYDEFADDPLSRDNALAVAAQAVELAQRRIEG